MGKWAVICSPVSGTKKGREVVENVLIPSWKRYFPKEENSMSVFYTERYRHAVDLAKDNSSCDGIIVVGGDGTVHEVLEGLAAVDSLGNTKIGLLSQGTMNFYFVTAGLPEAQDLPSLIKDKSFRPSPLMKVYDNAGVLDSSSFEAFHIGKMAYNVCEAVKLWRFRPGGVMAGIFLNLIVDNLLPSFFSIKGRLEIVRTNDKKLITFQDNFFWIVCSHRNPYNGCVGEQMWVSFMTLASFPGFGTMMEFFKPPMGHYAGLGYIFEETIACDSFVFSADTSTNVDRLGCVLDGDAYVAGNRVTVVNQAKAMQVVASQKFPVNIPKKYIEITSIPPAAKRWLDRNPPTSGISLYKPVAQPDSATEYSPIVKMIPLLLKILLPLILLVRYRHNKLKEAKLKLLGKYTG